MEGHQCAKEKEEEDMFKKLPREIVLNISLPLLELPLKSLGQLKCLSKTMHSVINDPHFVKEHTAYHLKNYQGDCHLVHHPRPAGDSWSLVFKNGKTEKRNQLLCDCRISGYCDGLVCLVTPSEHNVIVWNPSTDESRRVPYEPSSVVSNFTIVYDPLTDEYMIVRFPVRHHRPCENVEVFGLKTNSWRTLPYNQFPLVDGNRLGPYYLITYDAGNECFDEVPLSGPALKKCRGCLSLCVYHDDHSEILMVREYKMSDSWNNLLMVPWPYTNKLTTHLLKVISSESTGYLNGDLYIFHSYNDKVTNGGISYNNNVIKCGHRVPYKDVPYIESLVSPYGNGNGALPSAH